MRDLGVRTFPGRYQALVHARNRFMGRPDAEVVASARAFLAILGIAFAVTGVYLAWAFDRLVGIGFLIVGAFLLILPFSTLRTEE